MNRRKLLFFLKIAGPLMFLVFSNRSFAQSSGVGPIGKSNGGYEGFEWHGRKRFPEIVAGATGNAVRTDGYSSYLSLKKSVQIPPRVQLSAYFALETYPTDTAGLLTIYNSQTKGWIAASVDKYGTLLLCVFENGKYYWTPVNTQLEKFKWMHLALSLNGTKAWLSINGKKSAAVKIDPDVFSAIDSLDLGKDGRLKKIGVFPVNYFNGIIEHPQLAENPDQVPNPGEIARIVRAEPRLAIPASRFAGDFTRPAYHLLPAANWTNETHGLIYYNGLYHIFNQKNGANLFLGQINWGHYTSPDLIHWTEQKPILTPGPGYDQSGIWSGCIVPDAHGVPNIFYSSSGPDSFDVCRALPNDKSLLTWNKPSGNPVISSSPGQYSRKDFHDPYVWQEGQRYYMIVGFGLTDGGTERGAVLLYRSDDLKTWTYLHPLFSGNPSVDNSGVFWEMPVFYKVQDKYILLVNKTPHKGVRAKALYWTGKFENEKFVPDNVKPQSLEVINRLLSPSVAKDADGNIVAIAIIPDETSPRATYNVGWTHLYSIPRVWTLRDGKICQSPYPALQSLRTTATDLKRKVLASGDTLLLAAGQQQEISVDLQPDSTGTFGFIFGKDPSGQEQSKIYYDFKKHQLIIDQTKSSKRKYIPLNIRAGDYLLAEQKKVNFHLFFDGSVIEGFINDEDAFTTRVFPESSGSDQIELFTEGGTLKLLGGTVWKLKSSPVKTNF